MSKLPIILRADGDSKTGLGHIYRMAGLAGILSEEFECIFVTTDPMKPVIEEIGRSGARLFLRREKNDAAWEELLQPGMLVATDGYEFDNAFHARLKQKGCFVIHMEDLFRDYENTDVLINPVPGVSLDDYPGFDGILASGARYAPLRECFRKAAAETSSKKKFMLITMGGSDIKNLSVKYCRMMLDHFPEENISLLTGSANGNLKEIEQLSSQNKNLLHYHALAGEEACALFKEHSFVLTPSSVSCFEAIACGCHIITGFFADNQVRFNQWLGSKKTAFNLGDLENYSFDETLMEFITAPGSFTDREVVRSLRNDISSSGRNLLRIFSDQENFKIAGA
jgi:UDP-2,4-diacetamido-2,4,6-trideoxy-beta-L-altropyranose hydrolase